MQKQNETESNKEHHKNTTTATKAPIGSFFYQFFAGEKIRPLKIDENVETILGYNIRELMNPEFDMLTLVHPNFRKDLIETYRAACNSDSQYEIESIVIHKKGFPLFIKDCGVSVVGPSGKKDVLIGCMQCYSDSDIASMSLKKTGLIMKQAHEAGTLGSFYFSITDDKIYWSEQIKKIYGVDKEPTPAEYCEFMDIGNYEEKKARLQTLIYSREGQRRVYNVTRKTDNSIRQVLSILFPIVDNEMNLIAISGSTIDITDLEYHQETRPLNDLQKSWQRFGEKDSIFIKHGGKIVPVPVNDIIAISSMRDYVQLFTTGRTAPYIYYSTLKDLLELLPQHIFCRIHRSHIINVRHIDDISANQVKVRGFNFPVSRNYKARLLKVIRKKN